MNSALVSCIIPVFNCERYISEGLSSALHQSYQPLEIIVVDDGSTDGTPAIAANYREQIRYFRQENAGPTAARNRGVRMARGAFVALLDADDVWDPNKLAHQMERFQARQELGVSLTYVQNFWSAELPEGAQRMRDRGQGKPVPGYCMSTPVIRHRLFDTVGEFNPKLAHADGTEWFLRAAEKNVVIELLPETLVYRRLHATNRSRQMAADSHAEYLGLVKRHLDRQRQRGGTNQGGTT